MYSVWGIRHGVSLLLFPGDIPPVTLCVLDTMPYSSGSVLKGCVCYIFASLLFKFKGEQL